MTPPILWALALTVAGSLITGAAALRANPARLANRQLFVLSVHLSLWALSVFHVLASFDASGAALWIRIASIVVAFAPTSFTLVRLSITERNSRWPHIYRKALRPLAIDAAVALICLTPFFLRRVHKPTIQSIPDASYGPGYFLFTLCFIVACVLSGRDFYRDYRIAREIERVELQYVLLGFAVSFVIGVTAAFILPALTGTTVWARFGPLGVLALDAIIAYGIVRDRILNVDVAIRRFFALLIAATLYASVFTSVFLPMSALFRQVGLKSPLWAAITSALLCAYGPEVFRRLPAAVLSQIGESPDERRIRELTSETAQFLSRLSVPELLSLRFARSSAEITLASYVGLWHFNHSDAECLAEHGKPPASLSGCQLSQIASWANGIVTDHGLERSGNLQGAAVLRSLGLRMVFGSPLRHGHALLILLGPRMRGGVYGPAEEHAIALLGQQFALAIENARLYTEVDDARRYNETLLQNVADGVIACDATGRITAVNREATRLLNIREDGPPTSLRELPPPVREALDHALAGSPPPPDLEARLPAEPAPHIVRVSARALRRSDGTPLGAIATLHDVTAERRFEERARRADRLASVGTLAASMAHEIKNPLVTIKTFIQLLPRAFDDPDLRASICPLIGTEVERIDMVVNRLLDFARPVQPTLTPLHLHEVLAQTLRLIDPRRRARNIRTIADLQADDDRILGDRALLEQVFVNLCFNAIEAMPHGGTLTLSSALVQVDSGQRDLWGQQIFLRRLRVSVRDTGIGIPPDVLPRIFDPFFTTKADGSGLGLTIAHGILQEHHATIDIESRPGAGTVVHVFFQPLETAAQEGNSA